MQEGMHYNHNHKAFLAEYWAWSSGVRQTDISRYERAFLQGTYRIIGG